MYLPDCGSSVGEFNFSRDSLSSICFSLSSSYATTAADTSISFNFISNASDNDGKHMKFNLKVGFDSMATYKGNDFPLEWNGSINSPNQF